MRRINNRSRCGLPVAAALKITVMEIVKQEKTTVKQQLTDILMDVSWAKVANRYFGKSSSWLYHKFDGIDGNGGSGGFSAPERLQLKSALTDLSERIRTAAEHLDG
jgi:hypothetical protein